MPTISIDDEVKSWLASHITDFEDTPNSVLRRIAGLEYSNHSTPTKQITMPSANDRKGSTSPRPIRGSSLARSEGLSVSQALYHCGGTFFGVGTRFPLALFDPKGYVIFSTDDSYRNSPSVTVMKRTNIPKGISKIPGYLLMKHPPQI